MKVIYESSIFEQMKEVINSSEQTIVRVEMTHEEFSELLYDIFGSNVVDEGVFDKISIPWPFTVPTSRRAFYNTSGSYVVYKGVCFQTHSSYTD